MKKINPILLGVLILASFGITIYYANESSIKYASKTELEGIQMLARRVPDLRKSTTAGVTLWKCPSNKAYLPAELQNNNADTVQIKAVWNFQGETTQWIENLAPGQSKIVLSISHQHGFYISDKTGKELGYISGAD